MPRRLFGEEQCGHLMLFESPPQVMSVGFGDSAALAVLPGRDRWKFFFASGQDIAIALLQVRVFAAVELFAFALGEARAALLQ